MAIENDAYATPDQYLSGIRSRGGNVSANIADIERDLIAISRYIDDKLHTFFWKSTTPLIRYFQPESRLNPRFANEPIGWTESENPWARVVGGLDLAIDPIYDITDLEVVQNTNRNYDYSGETPLVHLTDFIMEPRNALTGPEPRPYSNIKRLNQVWLPNAEVRVTGLFGWLNVPAVIEKLCIELAALLRIETPRATNRVNELGGTTEVSRQCDYLIDSMQKVYKRQLGFR